MKRSYVYFNLQRRVWSERQAGKVIDHPQYIVLKDARFLVGKAGQSRVRSEGRKNVHAGISGYNSKPYAVLVQPELEVMAWWKVSYNPYENDTFVRHDGKPILSANWVVMDASGDRPVVWASTTPL